MINPYTHFGHPNVWPRGFNIKNIAKQTNDNFYLINSTNFTPKLLIFQGLINGLSYIDAILSMTRIKFQHLYNFNKSEILSLNTF